VSKSSSQKSRLLELIPEGYKDYFLYEVDGGTFCPVAWAGCRSWGDPGGSNFNCRFGGVIRSTVSSTHDVQKARKPSQIDNSDARLTNFVCLHQPWVLRLIFSRERSRLFGGVLLESHLEHERAEIASPINSFSSLTCRLSGEELSKFPKNWDSVRRLPFWSNLSITQSLQQD
jgi:hypothetical protein